MKDQHWLGAVLVLLTASAPAFAQVNTVTVVHADDFATGRTETHYLLEEPSRKQTRRIRPEEGRRLETTTATRVVAGERRAAVILVDLQDSDVSCPASQVSETFFTGASSTAKAFQEMSFQKISFPEDSNGDGDPDVFGPFKVNAWRASPCEYWKWSAEADAAATAAGVDLSLYQHRMYLLPSNTSCGYSGLGTVGCAGSVCQAWAFSCSSYVFTHEIGHNLGMQHAASDSDGNGMADDEYGDGADVMGCCAPFHANAPHKAQMGWLPPEKVADLKPGSHFLRLAPIEADPADTLDPQALRALGFYYVSTRKALGFDAGLPASYVDRVSIHRYSDWEPACVYTGEGKPRGYACNATRTLHVKTLQDGETFEDAAQGLRITPVSHGSGGAMVDVQVEPPGRDFYTLSPCRLFNTRESWPLASGSEEIFVLKGLCGIPPTAKALAVNVTVTGPTAQGSIALYPGHVAPSGTSTISFGPEEIRANSAVVALSADGYGTIRALPSVQSAGTVHMILDVFGYFE